MGGENSKFLEFAVYTDTFDQNHIFNLDLR